MYDSNICLLCMGVLRHHRGNIRGSGNSHIRNRNPIYLLRTDVHMGVLGSHKHRTAGTLQNRHCSFRILLSEKCNKLNKCLTFHLHMQTRELIFLSYNNLTLVLLKTEKSSSRVTIGFVKDREI